MSKIHAVLLVPEDGDPHGLLKEGVCGARAPIMARAEAFVDIDIWVDTGWCRDWTVEEWHQRKQQRALVLAWDGEPVVEGIDRMNRCRKRTPVGHIPKHLPVSLPAELFGAWLPAMLAADQGLGTIILLDAEGREVTDA